MRTRSGARAIRSRLLVSGFVTAIALLRPLHSAITPTALADGAIADTDTLFVDDEADELDAISQGSSLRAVGISAYIAGDLRRAERVLKRAVMFDRSDEIARLYLAEAYRARGTPVGREAAEDVLLDLTLVAPDNPEYQRNLGEVRSERRFYSEARNAYQEALARLPDDRDLLRELAVLAERDWWRHYRLEDLERARSLYGRLLGVQPTDARSHLRMAVLALDADSVDVAAPHVQALLTHHPNDVETQLIAGVFHEYRDDFGRAEAHFRSALAMMPGFDRAAYEEPIYLDADAAMLFTSVGDALSKLDLYPPEKGFWAERDPTPGTPVNERFVIHASRVAMADFSYGRPDLGFRGWEIAPGEFYIRYGKPLERRYETMAWLHWFNVNGQAQGFGFVDEFHNGRFEFPIERGMKQHHWLRANLPDDPHLGGRVDTAPFRCAAAWFREESGAPRLEVTFAGERRSHVAEVVVSDTSWVPVYESVGVIAPTTVPRGLPIVEPGLFRTTYFPGPTAATLRATIGRRGSASLELNRPVAETGFAVSDLWLGYRTDDGFLSNPGAGYRPDTPLVVRFEVYAYHTDAVGLGYLELRLSVVPEEGERRGFGRAIVGRGAKPFVAAELTEEATGWVWERELEIDLTDLREGTYSLVLEARDTITRESDWRDVRFEVLPER